MQQSLKATLLGLFVIGMVLILLTFGFYKSRQMALSKDRTYVLYLQGTLKGVHIGSPVTHRGMKVGEVTGLKIVVAPKTGDIRIPIFIQFYDEARSEEPTDLPKLIKRGLRAQLQSYTLIPAVDSIEINYFPGTPILLVHGDTGLPEIPTLESAGELEELSKTLHSIQRTFDNVNKLVGSNEMKQSVKALNVALTQSSELMKTMNNNIEPLLVNMNDSLKEMSQAAFSLKNLADFLARHPEALVQGKAK